MEDFGLRGGSRWVVRGDEFVINRMVNIKSRFWRAG